MKNVSFQRQKVTPTGAGQANLLKNSTVSQNRRKAYQNIAVTRDKGQIRRKHVIKEKIRRHQKQSRTPEKQSRNKKATEKKKHQIFQKKTLHC